MARVKLGRLAVITLMTAGCASRGPADMPDCTRVEGELTAGANTTGLAGEYRLTVVATSGDQAGRSTSGRLSLHAYEGAMRQMRSAGGNPIPNVTVPLYGTVDLRLDDIGGAEVGDLMSMDEMRPGVILVDQRRSGSAPQVTIRLGAEANRRDMTAIEGAYVALRVREIESNRFAGTWTSGVTGTQAEGYFCAVRVQS